jgi:hypothetical protein
VTNRSLRLGHEAAPFVAGIHDAQTELTAVIREIGDAAIAAIQAVATEGREAAQRIKRRDKGTGA